MPDQARQFCTSAPYRFVARRLVMPWALQGVRPTGEVLEIGTGSGAMAAEVLRMFGDLHLVATDYDPEMVSAARATLAPWAGRATAQQADATSLPFDDARFGLVLSCAMLHHVGHWEAALAEALRVLRPGARLVGFDLLRTAPMRLLHGLGGGRAHG
ncbi:MAG: class I SAM-dependent methyltransferase, partial [Acidimicrobiales bacterium]